MLRTDKKQALAKMRGEPEASHAQDPTRLQAFAEIIEWLEARRRQVNIPPDSPEMQEILAAVEEHRDYLNEQWCGASEEEFKESLRRYARAVSQEMLRVYKSHERSN